MKSCKTSLAAAALIALVALGGCSTVDRFNPFKGKGPPQETAEGERISIVAEDQKLEPAEALKGVDFALPPTQTVTDWPLRFTNRRSRSVSSPLSLRCSSRTTSVPTRERDIRAAAWSIGAEGDTL